MNITDEWLLIKANLHIMATVLITGGTGLVGQALRHTLQERGYRVIILSRDPAPGKDDQAAWNPVKQTIDREAIAAADHIIHLAGAGVADKRWSRKRKQEILDSRVQGSRLIANSLQTLPNKVKTVVSASAIGWYGADPQLPNPHPFSEDAPAANDFLGSTCREWEAGIKPVTTAGIRLVTLRIGIVLSREGGALREFIKPLRWGVAAILGKGDQVISWVHIQDLVNMFIASIENESMTGVYNAVAPHPVSNRELVQQLVQSAGKKRLRIRVPGFLLKLIMGEMSIEILKSTTVSSRRISDTGFHYQYEKIGPALKSFF